MNGTDVRVSRVSESRLVAIEGTVVLAFFERHRTEPKSEEEWAVIHLLSATPGGVRPSASE